MLQCGSRQMLNISAFVLVLLQLSCLRVKPCITFSLTLKNNNTTQNKVLKKAVHIISLHFLCAKRNTPIANRSKRMYRLVQNVNLTIKEFKKGRVAGPGRGSGKEGRPGQGGDGVGEEGSGVGKKQGFVGRRYGPDTRVTKNAGDIGDNEPARSGTSSREIGESSCRRVTSDSDIGEQEAARVTCDARRRGTVPTLLAATGLTSGNSRPELRAITWIARCNPRP